MKININQNRKKKNQQENIQASLNNGNRVRLTNNVRVYELYT